MKITQSLKIKAWCQRFDTFQTYLPMTLWLAGAKRREQHTGYDKYKKREILDFSLLTVYLTALNDIGWCLQENTYAASIGKLVEIEPEIYKKIKALKVTAANSAAIQELQQKSSKKANNCGSGGISNSCDSKAYCDCKTCGKRHPGICWDLEKGNSNQKKRGCKFLTRDNAKEFMKSVYAKQCNGRDSDNGN